MAATWTPQGHTKRSAQSVQAQTEATPVNGDASGINLDQISAITIFLTAPDVQTFTGTGWIRIYLQSFITGKWFNAHWADIDLTDMAGLASGALASLPVVQTGLRCAPICDTVGLSGAGGLITMDLLVSERPARNNV